MLRSLRLFFNRPPTFATFHGLRPTNKPMAHGLPLWLLWLYSLASCKRFLLHSREVQPHPVTAAGSSTVGLALRPQPPPAVS